MTMTNRELYEYGKRRLLSEERDNETIILMEEVFGISRNDLFVHPDKDVDESRMTRFDEYISRRNNGEPVQYIIGHAPFYGIEFQTDKEVLIPRFDTEVLVEEVLKNVTGDMRLADICTGSGCILLSVMANCAGIEGIGTDISSKAVSLATRNNEKLGLNAKFIECDLFEGLDGLFDVIVSNPPYIETEVINGLEREVKDFEPRLALDGGADGLDFYKRIAKDSRKYLKKNGKLFFEIGYNEGNKVTEILRLYGFDDIKVLKDLNGLDRVVSAIFGG